MKNDSMKNFRYPKKFLKSASSQKVVTSEEEVGDCIELKVEKFKGTWMQSFNKFAKRWPTI